MVGSDPTLFTLAYNYLPSPERPGVRTPPIYSPAAVPFRWEESPGKPKPCTAITTAGFSRKPLDLPPRLLANQLSSTAAASDAGRFKYQSQWSSFRMVAGECYGSFREGSGSPETAPSGALMLSRRGMRKGLVGYWKRRALKGEKESGMGSHVFPSSADREMECFCGGEDRDEYNGDGKSVKITRVGSFSLVSTASGGSMEEQKGEERHRPLNQKASDDNISDKSSLNQKASDHNISDKSSCKLLEKMMKKV